MSAQHQHADYVPVPLPEKLQRPALRVHHDDADPGILSGTDEKLNFYTHGAGFAASVIGTSVLFLACQGLGDFWLTIACVLYGLALMSVFGASTLSHGDFSQEKRHLFRTLDQVSIFLLIAASSSPFLLAYCRNWWGMCLLGGTWALALAGAGAKLFVTRKHIVPVWYYVLVGWFPAMSLINIAPMLGYGGVGLLLASGVGFTTGVWFLVNDHRATWYHAIWHVLVVLSTGCQYCAILFFVVR
ncbi:MAG: hemolysin III family protein [Planctomycetaceae bacterium]|nr:hemolysin III family protein [Planctomycetaceae bacterium]MCB9954094.1 hemolysin III family protein [Planctomycetaceae bacterium]